MIRNLSIPRAALVEAAEAAEAPKKRPVQASAAEGRSVSPDPHVPTSAVLDGLFGGVPPQHVTLDWLMRGLGDRSFGVVLLLLALLAALPGVSVVAGLLLLVPAYQMLRAHLGPVFPRAVAARPIAARRLARLVRGIVPVLRAMERVIHPRWPTPFEANKRAVGGAVLLLGAGLIVPDLALGFAALAAEVQERAMRRRLSPADPVRVARFIASRRAPA